MAIKYNLTDTQIKQLAIIAYREQGNSDVGVRACASHMYNYYEKWQSKKYSNPYDCTIKSGWYWSEANNRKYIEEHPNVPQSVISAVKDVIVNGNRVLPAYVDEYDCLSDIVSASNNGNSFYVKDRKQYKQDVTKITNRYGSTYTFYCFPDGASGYCDAFGYINKSAPSTNQEVTILPASAKSIPDTACTLAEDIAIDQSHGYSQINRWGPDFDCSSLIIYCYIKAGLPIDKNKVYYTGNLDKLKDYGFVDVTNKVNLNTGEGILRGDILYYHISGTNGHTAMYCGNGKIVHARGQSYGSPATGDQGTEIAITDYYRGQWQHVLRYQGSGSSSVTPVQRQTTIALTEIQKGSIGEVVRLLQTILKAMGYNGVNGLALELDGDFGGNTEYALKNYQSAVGLEADGVAGKNTWTKIKTGLIVS